MPRVNRVLIVDDEPSIRRSLGRVLRLHGFETLEASGGAEALQQVIQSPPDLVILDIRMPGMDGVEAFARIRSQQPNLPAIFMTAYASCERALAAQYAGGLCVMPKPLEIDDLLSMIQVAITDAPVLIVDDQVDFLRSLARSLQAAGIQSTTVASLELAVSELRKRPDRVVIADVFLDDGNGLDLLSEFDTGSSPPPLILVTGRADWYSSSAAESQLANLNLTCLPKPLDIEGLVRTVQGLQVSRTQRGTP